MNLQDSPGMRFSESRIRPRAAASKSSVTWSGQSAVLHCITGSPLVVHGTDYMHLKEPPSITLFLLPLKERPLSSIHLWQH